MYRIRLTFVCMYVCMYIRHTIVYYLWSHSGVVSVVWSSPQISILQATAACLRSLFVRFRWSLDKEESKCDRATARKRKQRAAASEDTKTKEREDDRLRKRRCLQGEMSGAR